MVFFCLSLSDSPHMASKSKTTLSWNLLHSGTSFFNPTLFVKFHDEKTGQDFSENFSKRGIHSERHVILSDFSNTALPTVIHSQGWESLCKVPVSCPFMIIHEFYSNMHGFDSSLPWFITSVRGTCIIVTLELIYDVLHVPRVSHPNYPGCPRLRTMSKDDLQSHFCETPFSWGDCQNTSYSGFAKGLRFLNIVMTLFSIPCLTIILLPSLVLAYCFPSLRTLLINFPSVRDFIILSNTNRLGLWSNAIKDLYPFILPQFVVGWIDKAHGLTRCQSPVIDSSC